MDDAQLFQAALEQARIGLEEGGIPIGSALASRDGVILGAGRNRRIQEKSPTRHAEIDALEVAGRQPAEVYRQATLYTTLSPCHMCSGAVLLYGIPRVVIGEHQTFLGAESLLRHHGVELIALDSDECVGLMSEFISKHPDVWREDIGEA